MSLGRTKKAINIEIVMKLCIIYCFIPRSEVTNVSSETLEINE